jgi:hypothetical protein
MNDLDTTSQLVALVLAVLAAPTSVAILARRVIRSIGDGSAGSIEHVIEELTKSVDALRQVQSDHISLSGTQHQELRAQVQKIEAQMNALSSRIIVVEDKQAAYAGPDRRKLTTPPKGRQPAKRQPAKKKVGSDAIMH